MKEEPRVSREKGTGGEFSSVAGRGGWCFLGAGGTVVETGGVGIGESGHGQTTEGFESCIIYRIIIMIATPCCLLCALARF